jgi:hypothetical protein
MRFLSKPSLAAVARRGFATTPVALGISPYCIFVKKAAGRPELKKLGFKERGKLLAHWYRNLPADRKAEIIKEAKRTPYPKQKKDRTLSPRLKYIKKHGVNNFIKFVTAEIKKPQYAKLAPKARLRAVAAAWRKLHPKKAASTKKAAPKKAAPAKAAPAPAPAAAPKAKAPKAAEAKKAAPAAKAAKAPKAEAPKAEAPVKTAKREKSE